MLESGTRIQLLPETPETAQLYDYTLTSNPKEFSDDGAQ